MRRAMLLFVLLLVPGTMFAQGRDDRDDSWRDRPAEPDRYRRYDVRRDNYFELTPFGGYRYGGTIFDSSTDLFGRDLELESRANIGATFGIPLGDQGVKLELMINHQSTHLTTGGGLFDPGSRIADLDVTYYHAGVLFPFAQSRTATPFVVVSAGVTNLDLGLPDTSSDNRFSASAGIGVKIPFNRNVALRVEARGYFSSLDTDDRCSRCGFEEDRNLYQGETNIGLAFSF